MPSWRLLPLTLGLSFLQGAAAKVYSDISNVGDFVTHLDISPEDGDRVTSILDGYTPDGDHDVASRADLACRVSEVLFGDGFFGSLSSEFNDLIQSHWSSTCWLQPTCIVEAASAEDVSKAMSMVSFLGTKFSVRSGGHNPNSGFANVAGDGIVLDLRKLNEVSPDCGDSTVCIGPGNRFGDVYKTLQPSGQTIVGGRINDVGVGGYLLGGGLSHFANRYGMAADRVRSFEVVLANSSIVSASAQQNPDLFWALKGGGPNFGVVTKFEVETVPNSEIWVEGFAYNSTQFDAIMEALVKYGEASEDDSYATIISTFTPDTCSLIFIYGKPEERPAVYSMFYDIPSAGQVMESQLTTWIDLNNAISASPIVPTRREVSTVTVKWDSALLKDTLEAFQDLSGKVSESIGASMSLVVQPFSSKAVEQSLSRGGNPTNIQAVSQSFLESTIEWANEADDEVAVSAVKDWVERTRSAAQNHGVALDYLFMNDAGSFQNVIASYGTESVQRMTAVSQSYDSHQVFQEIQNNGFLLSKA